MIELKEQRILKYEVAVGEAEKLREISDVLAKLKKMRPKNYVICLARQADRKSALPKRPLHKGCRFVLIVLKNEFKMAEHEYEHWRQQFRLLARYEAEKHAVRGGAFPKEYKEPLERTRTF